MKLVPALLLVLLALISCQAKKGAGCKKKSKEELCAELERAKKELEEELIKPAPSGNGIAGIEAESLILQNKPELLAKLEEYLEPVEIEGLSWKLCYRGSDEGFYIKSFWPRCAHKGPTVTLIQATTGNIFGAFVSRPWGGQSSLSENAFIFSLQNRLNKPFKSDVKPDMPAMHHAEGHGPGFGNNGADLNVPDRCDTTLVPTFRFGTSYVLPFGYTVQSPEAQSILAGESQFKCKEFEMFVLA